MGKPNGNEKPRLKRPKQEKSGFKRCVTKGQDVVNAREWKTERKRVTTCPRDAMVQMLGTVSLILFTKRPFHLYKWAIPGLFLFIFVFSIQLTVKCSILFFADDGILTAYLWNWKWPIYQLSHCPINIIFYPWYVFRELDEVDDDIIEVTKEVSKFAFPDVGKPTYDTILTGENNYSV